MTFENKNLTETKPSETRAGLIYLQKKETNETPVATPRQFPNQSRKRSSAKKNSSSPPPSTPNQPQPITQSLRGLTNVTRTLYDPNAPTPKTPPITVIQPQTSAKTTSTPPAAPLSPVPQTNVNPQVMSAQLQEFHQQ